MEFASKSEERRIGPRLKALQAQKRELIAALEIAQSHIGWCWDQIEEHTRLRRAGSEGIHNQIRTTIDNCKGDM